VNERAKILVIDDEDVIRESCSRILAQQGCEVITAAAGKEGLAAIKGDPQGFAVVLLDLKMPGMDGIAVLGAAKEVNPALLIVVITGYATVDSAVEAMKKGAYDFIAKPFTPDQLSLIVNRALEKRKLELEAEQLRAEAASSLRDVATEKSKVRTIINSMAYGILATNREGRIVLTNPAATRMLEIDPNRCLDKSVSEAVGDERLMEAVQGVLEPANPAVTTISQELRRGDALIRARTAAVKSDEGEVLGTVTVFEDMTYLYSRALVQMSNDGILVFNEDRSIAFTNRMATVLTGYPPEELLGKDVCSILGNEVEELLGQLKSPGDNLYQEVRISTGGGEQRDINLCLALADAGESGVKGCAYLTDITQRKQLERELRETNDFRQRLIESSPYAIIATDIKGNIIVFNRAAEELIGHKASEVLGKIHITELYPPGIAKEVMKKLRSPDYGGGGRFTGSDFKVVDKWGKEIPIHLSAAIVYQGDQEVATVGIFTDLRPRIVMEQKLQETHLQLIQLEKLRSLGEMAAGVAHEINNPLGGILIYASLLMERLAPDDAQREDLGRIVQEATRCQEIVKSLLQFARQSDPKKELLDINRAITDGLHFLENQATFHNIEIIKELDPSLPPLLGNAGQLKQVFLNIIINAADAMHARGVLTIKTFLSEDGNRVVIEFTDTGEGIPEDILPRIFDPFFTTKAVGEGTGLGLSMSYGIVKEHKGHIEVDTVPGSGTTFRVLLPVDYEEASA
jgi:two-component system NtrC family sensor kinase